MRPTHLIAVSLALCLTATLSPPAHAAAEQHRLSQSPFAVAPATASAVADAVTSAVTDATQTPSRDKDAGLFELQGSILSYLRESLEGMLGIAYRFGSLNPARGLDCSGLVVHVFSRLGFSDLPRTASGLAGLGSQIDKGELRFGDLVFFNTRGRRYSHVGIYIGEGRFIHAATRGRKVMESSLDERYYQTRYNGARRLINVDS